MQGISRIFVEYEFPIRYIGKNDKYMELRQLKYFEKACELENFSEASRQLFISQSTLSQQIKQLEDELGVLLFDRIGKRVTPTEAGRAFLPYARKSIQEAENGKQIIQDIKGIRYGVLNIGATYSLSNLFAVAVSEFNKVYPHIQVVVKFATSSEQMEMLENNLVDCILSFMPKDLSDEYEKIFLFSSQLYFIVHKSHPLASISSISLKKLSEISLILPAEGFATRRKIDKMCVNNNLRLNIGMEINDVQTIIKLINNGNWATILTQAAIKGEQDLVKIPILVADKLISQAYLFWPKGVYRKKSAIAFSEFVVDAVKKGIK